MILPIILLTILRLQYVLSTSDNTLIYSYSRSAQNDLGRYQNSLTNLLGTLASQTTNNPGFYNFTTTASSENLNQLHGLYLCRGDINPQTCQSCVNFAKNHILQKLLYGSDEGLAWYNNCMVRFSNESFFGKWDAKMGSWSWKNCKIKGSRIQFLRILWHTMKQLAIKASNTGDGNKFASKVVRVTSLESLYAMVQCTPDLMASDCYRCLANANQKLLGMHGSIDGKVFYSSCMAQYKTTSSIAHKMLKPLLSPTFSEENNSTQTYTPKKGTHHDAVRSE